MLSRTKAQMLKYLRQELLPDNILPAFIVNYGDWSRNTESFGLSEIFNTYKNLIVRSSAISEDSLESSNAGGYDSFFNIQTPKDLEKAIHEVFDSYGDKIQEQDEVLIQPMLEDVSISGVLFTRDLNTMAPYYVVNYDDTSKRTDTVTSGSSNKLKVFTSFKGAKTDSIIFRNLFNITSTIENFLGMDHLDIEFAICETGHVYILQVRPLVLKDLRLSRIEEFTPYLDKISKKIQKICSPHPYLYGDYSMMGVMSDWNPAEMIGTRPHTLALSLYKNLITDRTWAYQRDNYGYKNLRSFPLIYSLMGIPYIDIRVSFNSFIPKSLSDIASRKLSKFYLDKLKRTPSKHDKIEFDIVYSTFYLGLEKELSELVHFDFSMDEVNELQAGLIQLTNSIIVNNGLFDQDIAKVESLRVKQDTIFNSNLNTVEKIYWLVEDCKRYGTLPFAGLARCGFIAIQWINSMLSEGIITREEYEPFMSSIVTIPKELSRDLSSMPKREFLEKYGHLRPGTYDINSKNYRTEYDKYLGVDKTESIDSFYFEFSESTKLKIATELSKYEFSFDADHLISFVRAAIEWRERAKFIFTRSIDMILELVADFGDRFGISREEMSFLSIETILGLHSNLTHVDLNDLFRSEIVSNKQNFEITKMIKLPDFISSHCDVWEFDIRESVPNFITLKKILAKALLVKNSSELELKGKIVFVESADPGYDWIFLKGIAGLVTMYGGANSHMAIRASELGIPAVIGCGHENFNKWSRSQLIEIDCENKTVQVIK